MITPFGLPQRPYCLPVVRREDYTEILAMMENAKAMPRTWAEHVEVTEHTSEVLREEGHIVVHVTIDPTEFLVFLARHKLRADAGTYALFAQVKGGCREEEGIAALGPDVLLDCFGR